MDWLECTFKKLAKEVSSEPGLITSLIRLSEDKLKSEKLLPLNATTISSKISLAYDSLRELLEALALKQGFKIYNHECYTSFLKEIIKDSSLGDDFDDMRILRNRINYYGKQVTEEACKNALCQMQKIREKVENYLKQTERKVY
ncbi:MAG TPA: hypothetical protein VJH95_04760 [Candidatus Nanoarchaeia archaeon]|nr:hypothetical protein [Candidatus Nanoarchaeia archaeon]